MKWRSTYRDTNLFDQAGHRRQCSHSAQEPTVSQLPLFDVAGLCTINDELGILEYLRDSQHIRWFELVCC